MRLVLQCRVFCVALYFFIITPRLGIASAINCPSDHGLYVDRRYERFSVTPDTTSSGRRILILEGSLDRSDRATFERALANNRPIHEVWLNSSGGSTEAALEIGQIIRRERINARVPNDWWCMSACVFLFIGGNVRAVEPRGILAVHNFSTKEEIPNRDIADSYGGRLAIALRDYLEIMGVSVRLLNDVILPTVPRDPNTNADVYRCLSQSENRQYIVDNRR